MKNLLPLLLFVVSVFLFSETAMAEKITREKALQVASDFFSKSSPSHRIPQNIKVLKTSEDMPKFATKGANISDPYFYIISGDNGDGFVIVSARDIAKPILAYSLEGKANFSDMPGNMESWLEFIRGQIKWAEENNISSETTQKYWSNISAPSQVVKYLETASWNQGNPYNLQCQYIENYTCVTGCVATAIAEVMRYHKWPNNGIGTTQEYNYTLSDGKIEIPVTIPGRDLSSHTYGWGNMPLSYNGSETQQQRNEVATLMADIGSACQLVYMPNVTSGHILFQSCLVNNFGYSKNLYFGCRDFYTDAQWINIIKSEIDSDRPLVYTGSDLDEEEGHAFVIDGYDEQDYFHVNWGWGGSDNGYFQISALNVQGLKFNSGQEALLNFYPGDISEPDPTDFLQFYQGGIKYTEEENYKILINELVVINFSACTFNGKIGFFITDRKGNIINEIGTTDDLSCDPGTGPVFANAYINGQIDPGNRIRVFQKPNGYNDWYPLYREGAAKEIIQEIVPSYNIENYTISDVGYASLYSGNNLVVPSGVEVYTYKYDSFSKSLIPGNAITEGDVIPANTGFTIKGNTGTYKFESVTENPGSYTSDLTGTLSEISKPSGNIYVLGSKSGKITFYKYTGDKIPAGKVYFVKPE